MSVCVSTVNLETTWKFGPYVIEDFCNGWKTYHCFNTNTANKIWFTIKLPASWMFSSQQCHLIKITASEFCAFCQYQCQSSLRFAQILNYKLLCWLARDCCAVASHCSYNPVVVLRSWSDAGTLTKIVYYPLLTKRCLQAKPVSPVLNYKEMCTHKLVHTWRQTLSYSTYQSAPVISNDKQGTLSKFSRFASAFVSLQQSYESNTSQDRREPRDTSVIILQKDTRARAQITTVFFNPLLFCFFLLFSVRKWTLMTKLLLICWWHAKYVGNHL